MKRPKCDRGTWTSEDRRALRNMYPRMDTFKLAKILRRTYESVKKQASRMKLKKK